MLMMMAGPDTKLTRCHMYPIHDYLNIAERDAVGRILGTGDRSPYGLMRSVRAVWTGEHRPPRKGEWYLSGSPIGGYRSGSDLDYAYHIARLVWSEPIEFYRVSPLIP